MPRNYVTTNLSFEELNPQTGRVWATLILDGEEVGKMVICSGPIQDILDFFENRLSLQELRQRWNKKRL